jgi:hypothetical protein
MQTTGALVGFFVAIYILALQRFYKSIEYFYPDRRKRRVHLNGREKKQPKYGYKPPTWYDLQINSINTVFKIFVGWCAITIFVNSLWLDSLSTKIVPYSVPFLEPMGLGFFWGSLALIFWWSVSLTKLIKNA